MDGPSPTPPAPARAAPPTAPVDPAGFAPCCEACGFDVSGLPDGPCPECGEAFAINQLRALHDGAAARRRSRLRPSLPGTLFVVAGLSATAVCMGEGPRAALWLAACTAAIGVWVYAHPSRSPLVPRTPPPPRRPPAPRAGPAR